MNHFITKCKQCETVINQCRCPSESKTVEWGMCASCKAEPKPCPFCGHEVAVREEDGRVLCGNSAGYEAGGTYCPASGIWATIETWNARV
jgi:hypothetical protein